VLFVETGEDVVLMKGKGKIMKDSRTHIPLPLSASISYESATPLAHARYMTKKLSNTKHEVT
jgi:hypothetical protein